MKAAAGGPLRWSPAKLEAADGRPVPSGSRTSVGSQGGLAMKIEQLMNHNVKTCRASDRLNQAAQLMWDNDLGFLPVVDGEDKLVGTLTDRDICMATYTQGQPPHQVPVWAAMAKKVAALKPNDSLLIALQMMQENQVRRLPVIDQQGRPVGVLTLSDLVLEASRDLGADAKQVSTEAVTRTLASIVQPRNAKDITQKRMEPSKKRDLRREVH
jgi:CBS domain-containing protein